MYSKSIRKVKNKIKFKERSFIMFKSFKQLKVFGLLVFLIIFFISLSACDSDSGQLIIEDVEKIEAVEISEGTSAEEIITKLPQEIEVTLSDERVETVEVVWETPDDFDQTTAGNYLFTGSILVEDISEDVEAEVIVIGEEDDDLEYFEETKFIPFAEITNIDRLSSDRKELFFQEETEFFNELQAGDILITEYEIDGAEDGLIKEVVDIDIENRSVEVEPAMLDQVIKQGEISITETVEFQDMVQNVEMAENMQIKEIDEERKRIEFTISENELGQLSGDDSFGEAGFVDGYIQVYTDTNINLIGSFLNGLEYFSFILIPGFEIGLDFEVENGLVTEEEWELLSFSLAEIPIFGPIVLSSDINLIAEAEADLSDTFKTGVSYGREIEIGVVYDGDQWDRINNVSGDGFQVAEPDFAGYIDVQGGAGLEFTAGVGVSGIAEAGLGTGLMSNVRGQGAAIKDFAEWNWAYDTIMFMEASIFARLSLLRIADLEMDLASFKFPDPDDNPFIIFYGASGQIKFADEYPDEDVEFIITGLEEFEVEYFAEEGFWKSRYLTDTVTITPEHEDYEFEPSSRTFSESSSDLNFKAKENSLTVNVEGNGTVEVVKDDEIWSVTQEKTIYFPEEAEISLKTISDTCIQFQEWTGDLDGEDENLSFSLGEDKEITANFDEEGANYENQYFCFDYPEYWTITMDDYRKPGEIYEVAIVQDTTPSTQSIFVDYVVTEGGMTEEIFRSQLPGSSYEVDGRPAKKNLVQEYHEDLGSFKILNVFVLQNGEAQLFSYSAPTELYSEVIANNFIDSIVFK